MYTLFFLPSEISNANSVVEEIIIYDVGIKKKNNNNSKSTNCTNTIGSYFRN